MLTCEVKIIHSEQDWKSAIVELSNYGVIGKYSQRPITRHLDDYNMYSCDGKFAIYIYIDNGMYYFEIGIEKR